MQDAWQIGRLFGIPLRVHFSWLLIFALVAWSLASAYFPTVLPDLPAWSYWVQAVVAALMLFVSIILHELGHSLVARYHGLGIASITLFVLGGVSQMKEEPREARQELQIAIVGPLISFVLAGLFALLATLTRPETGPTGLAALLAYLAIVNLIVAVFNMLPAFPLDGGRVLRSILWLRSGNQIQATRRAANVGRVLAIGLIVVGVLQLLGGRFGGLWLMLIGWFVMQAGTAAAAQASLRQALGDLRVRDVMVTDVKTVPAQATVHDLIEDYLVRYTYGGYPVVRDGSVVGLVTLHEIGTTLADARTQTPVERIMAPLEDRFVVDADTPLHDAFQRMATTSTGRLVVLDRGRLRGLITTNGVVRLAQIRSMFNG